MFILLLWTAVVGLIVHLLYKNGTKNHDYFSKFGLKFVKPLPFLGSSGALFFRRKISAGEWIADLYKKFPSERVIGLFDFTKPVYMIRDPELIKQITIKEFDHFPDHQQTMKNVDDPMMVNILTQMTGQRWRDMRSTLSPAFTGSKMRQMFELVADVSDQMAQFFGAKAASTPNGTAQVLDMKELFSNITTDSIATCAFGIKVNSFEHPNNDFVTMRKRVMSTSFMQIVRFMLMRFWPSLSRRLKLKLFSDDVTTFFRSLIIDTMDIRQRDHIVRPDMINLLMQVRSGDLKHDDEANKIVETDGFATVAESDIGKAAVTREAWTDTELVAQCLLFFLAGFDTSSTLLSFASNELALNDEIQQKLFAEVQETSERLNGKPLTYEALQSMRYMDQVISETLRKWPPAPFTDRECTRDFEVSGGGGMPAFTVRKGDQMWLPIFALHHDEKHFPDPERFDPERFSEERARDIVSGTYLPFGIGPRNCIGSRFALMNIKSVLYSLVKDFSFELCEKTVLPLRMGKMSIVPPEGIHLGLRARNTMKKE